MRSTSSTASGSSVTRCRARLHRGAEGRELADAQHLARLDRPELQVERARRRRACPRCPPAAAPGCRARRRARPASARRGCSRRRGGAAAGSARRSPRLPARRARASAGSGRRCRLRRPRRRGCRAPRRNATREPSASIASMRAHVVGHQPVADRLARRRSCCRPCRRCVQRAQVEGRRGRTARAASARAFSAPSVMPGSTRAAPALGVDARARWRRYLVQSMTRARFDGLAALAGAAAARQHGHALLAADRHRRRDVVACCAAPARRAARSGRWRRPSRSGPRSPASNSTSPSVSRRRRSAEADRRAGSRGDGVHRAACRDGGLVADRRRAAPSADGDRRRQRPAGAARSALCRSGRSGAPHGAPNDPRLMTSRRRAIAEIVELGAGRSRRWRRWRCAGSRPPGARRDSQCGPSAAVDGACASSACDEAARSAGHIWRPKTPDRRRRRIVRWSPAVSLSPSASTRSAPSMQRSASQVSVPPCGMQRGGDALAFSSYQLAALDDRPAGVVGRAARRLGSSMRCEQPCRATRPRGAERRRAAADVGRASQPDRVRLGCRAAQVDRAVRGTQQRPRSRSRRAGRPHRRARRPGAAGRRPPKRPAYDTSPASAPAFGHGEGDQRSDDATMRLYRGAVAADRPHWRGVRRGGLSAPRPTGC